MNTVHICGRLLSNPTSMTYFNMKTIRKFKIPFHFRRKIFMIKKTINKVSSSCSEKVSKFDFYKKWDYYLLGNLIEIIMT